MNKLDDFHFKVNGKWFEWNSRILWNCWKENAVYIHKVHVFHQLFSFDYYIFVYTTAFFFLLSCWFMSSFFFLFLSRHVVVLCVCVTFFKKKNRVYFLLTIQTWSYTHRNSENSSLGFVSFSFSEMVKSHFLESLNKKCRRRWICLFIARCNGLIHNLAREKKLR